MTDSTPPPTPYSIDPRFAETQRRMAQAARRLHEAQYAARLANEATRPARKAAAEAQRAWEHERAALDTLMQEHGWVRNTDRAWVRLRTPAQWRAARGLSIAQVCILLETDPSTWMRAEECNFIADHGLRERFKAHLNAHT